VLLPNVFWRARTFEPFDPVSVFAGGAEMDRLMNIARPEGTGGLAPGPASR